METEQGFPLLRQVVLDCTDARALAEFYGALLDWKVQVDDDGSWAEVRAEYGQMFCFQRVDDYAAPDWPGQERLSLSVLSWLLLLHCFSSFQSNPAIYLHGKTQRILLSRFIRHVSHDPAWGELPQTKENLTPHRISLKYSPIVSTR